MRKMRDTFKELFSYGDLLVNLALSELKLRYRGSALGFLWTVLNPLFFLLILAAVFSLIIRFQVENYTIFLFSGLVSWLMIQQTVIIATASVVNNQHLIRKVFIPKLVFPLSSVLARYVDHAALFVILIIFMGIYKAPIRASLVVVPYILLLHFVFSLGLSLLLAVAYVRLRDVQQIVAVVFQALFYATPILYPLDVLPENFQAVIRWNPIYYFVESLRWPVYRGAFPPNSILIAATGLAAAALVLGYVLFVRNEKAFVFHLS
ncbi:MAG: ABC transporter permease [Candidatus Aminicenantes bacterium]|nr:ABC transporter permease [Candidatus Aminicenantes bacterium]